MRLAGFCTSPFLVSSVTICYLAQDSGALGLLSVASDKPTGQGSGSHVLHMHRLLLQEDVCQHTRQSSASDPVFQALRYRVSE